MIHARKSRATGDLPESLVKACDLEYRHVSTWWRQVIIACISANIWEPDN